MDEVLKRLIAAAQRILKRKIHPVPRHEWDAQLRPGGKPTKLAAPLTPFARITGGAPVITFAASAPPHAGVGGFHVVRKDLKDAPNIINTDSYNQIDLAADPAWRRILRAAKLNDQDVEWLLCTYVFLTGPDKRADHHSAQVPLDIERAKPK